MVEEKFIKVSGSLHSHGFHTYYRNNGELARSPFDLEYFVRTCLNNRRDFQAITDI